MATSGYGRASFEFANGKPLELLDETGLLSLLKEHAGIAARIEPPDDWVDPTSAAVGVGDHPPNLAPRFTLRRR